MEGKDSAMGIPPPTGSGSNNSSSSNSSSSGSGATMMATSPPPPTGGVTVSLYQHGPSSAMTASAPTTTSTPTPTPTATVTVAATPVAAAAAPAPTQNQAAVPVAVAVPTTMSVQAATVPSVMTAAAQMPTVVTAAAALGPRSVTIASSDEKPITNTTNNNNVNSTTANANNSNSSSSNNNNNNSSSFPTCNPTPISSAAGPSTLIHGSQGQGIMGMNMGMNRPMPMGMGMGMNMGMGSGTPDSLKRKRGRPRKYGPDGSMALALAPLSSQPGPFSPLQKRGRGRPPGSGRKQRLAALGEWVLGSAGIGFTPHVITIAAGEDVASKIMSFSQQGPRAVCILSANGAISNVTLRQPATSGGTLTYEGRFEILSLSGSFLLTESGGTRSRTGGLSVSLASPDGRVIGGGVAGMLMAATPVQVVVGSFISNGQKDFTRPSNPESSLGMQQVPGSGPPTNAIPISRASLNDTYGGPGSPSLNQNTAGSYNTNTSQPPVHNMPSFQSMSWTGSQSMREARHNTDINISLPGG